MRRTILFIILTAALLTNAGRVSYAIQNSQVKPNQFLQIKSVSLHKTQVVAGSTESEITGTVTSNFIAPQNSRVNLSVSPLLVEAGMLAFPEPGEITIPQGSSQASFKIKTISNPAYASPTQCTVTAKMGDSSKEATFNVEQVKINSMGVLPAAGIGPFTANGTVTLNATPSPAKTVTLTSSDPSVLRFGSVGSAQNSMSLTFNNGALKTFPVFVSPVSRTTTVTVTAALGVQTLSRQITVRATL